MKKIRVGVVGLGGRGRDMLKLSVEGFDFVEATAACDIKRDNFYKTQWMMDKPVCEMFPDCAFFEDYDQMLEQADLDVVIVETGADIHAEFCAKAISKGINVLTDIPVVANLKEAELLWKATQNSSAILSVGANPNYQKFTVLLKQYHEAGLLGKPYYAEAEYIHWYMPDSETHMHLNENGDWRRLLCPIRYCTHSLGPLLTVIKEPLRTVSCFGTGPQSEESVKDDMSCAQFQTDSGVVVRLLRNGRCRARIGDHAYRVFGTEGYMERVDRNKNPLIRYNFTQLDDNERKEIGGEFMPPAYADNKKAVGHGGMDYAMLDDFYNAILEGREAPISLKDGLLMTLPGIYAEESSKRGGALMRMRYPWDDDWTAEFD